jgi:adenine phosphoribosyltransferase
MELRDFIKDCPDFPKPGILFRDISPLLADADAFAELTNQLEAKVKDIDFDYVLGVEARGFIMGAVLALQMKKGFVMCRKKGKLPGEVEAVRYDYEYASAEIEMQKNLIAEGSKILVVDDVLATGNTALATYNLLKKLKLETVAMLYIIELSALKGKELIQKGAPDIKQLVLLEY